METCLDWRSNGPTKVSSGPMDPLRSPLGQWTYQGLLWPNGPTKVSSGNNGPTTRSPLGT
ncbi:hypothetical protein EYF80_057774 [Liparis tanakae]|uniref:Uncharacterized protein n=1 Tax=Liparis tanakae TaxID=230148 RepID=A0A4Z2ET37_9TELE|nr:hypothetical protein EYF80_057774 [Liparis tanakae]